jgi:hypothetical protein
MPYVQYDSTNRHSPAGVAVGASIQKDYLTDNKKTISMSPPTPSPGSPYREEGPQVNKLLRGIELAVDEVLDNPDRPITRLEQEKLCYFAIKEFDLPITYSWYLAGACTKVSGEPSAAANRLNTSSTSIREDTGEDPDVREYRDYFASTEFFPDYTLRDIWFTNKYEFLQDFYEHYAPEEYLNLYLASTDIREQLENIDNLVQQETAHHSLSEWGAGSDDGVLTESDEREFRLLISDLHIEMSEIDDLSETISVITRGTDVLEQVFAQLTTLDSISSEQSVVLDNLAAYFYDDVWRYPALYISAQTAEGPNDYHLKGEHATRFTEFHEDLLSRANRMRNLCMDVGLYPDIGHHAGQVDEDVNSHLNSVMKEYIEERE